MVMNLILHPLSHCNSITEPCACFLLSLIKDLIIDFPSHFILSLIDVYKDTATCDKLIFPFVIMRIIRHSSVSYVESDHFPVMWAINVGTVCRSEAQFWPKWPRTEMATPLSTSAPSSSKGGVTLEAIMVQLQRMNARLDTLTDEMSYVTTCMGRIAWRQARLGGFIAFPSPSPQALEEEDDDDGFGDDDNDKDEDVSSYDDEEMTAF